MIAIDNPGQRPVLFGHNPPRVVVFRTRALEVKSGTHYSMDELDQFIENGEALVLDADELRLVLRALGEMVLA
jgi:hypothetical protein